MNNNLTEVRSRERVGLAIVATSFLVPFLVFVFFLGRGFSAARALETPKTVIVEPKSGFIEISNTLVREGVLARPASFRVYVLLRGWAGSLKSGKYTFSGITSVSDIARRLTSGSGDTEVTIPEGYTVAEIDKKIASQGILEPGAIILLSQSPGQFSYPFLQSENITTLEGFLFPDTYRFHYDTKPEEVARKMLDNFERKIWRTLEQEITKENESLYSVITLASLLEKESANQDERKIISGILWRRLELEIPLQVDAAVIYAWKQLNPAWKPKNHALSGADIKINSPYNTYRVKGLPPGPIANPGLDAIQAALDPAESNYWYYLATRDGKTIFSRTFEEHKQTKALYLAPQ